jgi:ribose transport system permease protein
MSTQSATGAVPRAAGLATAARQILRFLRSPSGRALLSLGLVMALGFVFNADGAFLSWGTHRDMLRQVSVCGILACGMTLVIITAGIDLSVGSILGLVAVLFSLVTIRWGWQPVIGIPLCLLAGAACGALSGALIAGFSIQPFIATLAMMVFARGLAKFVSGGQKISTAVPQADGTYQYVAVPDVFNGISAKVLNDNLAVVTLILLACVLVCGVLLARLRWGRYLYAIGGNEEAARLSGVPVVFSKVLAYGLSGLFCAVAGICQAAQELQGDPEAGSTYELSAIAIVVIGGTSLRGGRGGMVLTLLGVLTIGYLEKILSINAVGEASRLMLTGAIIVGAVLFQRGRK